MKYSRVINFTMLFKKKSLSPFHPTPQLSSPYSRTTLTGPLSHLAVGRKKFAVRDRGRFCPTYKRTPRLPKQNQEISHEKKMEEFFSFFSVIFLGISMEDYIKTVHISAGTLVTLPFQHNQRFKRKKQTRKNETKTKSKLALHGNKNTQKGNFSWFVFCFFCFFRFFCSLSIETHLVLEE